MKRRALLTFLISLSFTGLHAPIFCQNSPSDESSDPTKKVSQNSKRRMYRTAQRTPTSARYKEIQTALARHGYNPGPIDGRWGSKTSAALMHFEKAHGLRADGKLDALALILLGLGPKRPSGVSKQE